MARSRRPTLEHYKQVLQLRRARVPSGIIVEIIGLSADAVAGLIDNGLPAKKDAHPAQRAIKAVLVEAQAGQVTQALDWAADLSGAARAAASERAQTSLMAAQIEKMLVTAWKSKVELALSKAGEDKVEDLGALLPGRELLMALRTLRWARDLGPDVRAPIDVYRRQLDGEETPEEVGSPVDPSIYRDLLELNDDQLEHFAVHGQKRPKQLELGTGQ
jgi:hypothetical protein